QMTFQQIKEFQKTEEIINRMQVSASPYWNNHYLFDKSTRYGERHLGTNSINNILINTIAPCLFYFGKGRGEEIYCDKAFSLLESIPAEQNHILQEWMSHEVQVPNAYAGQALLGLYKNFCSQKKCLNCSLGIEILRRHDE
nr:DUF2851 family protein [Bacteroidia bacterium]